MKEKYEPLHLEIVEFETEDVITDSSGGHKENYDSPYIPFP